MTRSPLRSPVAALFAQLYTPTCSRIHLVVLRTSAAVREGALRYSSGSSSIEGPWAARGPSGVLASAFASAFAFRGIQVILMSELLGQRNRLLMQGLRCSALTFQLPFSRLTSRLVAALDALAREGADRGLGRPIRVRTRSTPTPDRPGSSEPAAHTVRPRARKKSHTQKTRVAPVTTARAGKGVSDCLRAR